MLPIIAGAIIALIVLRHSVAAWAICKFLKERMERERFKDDLY